MKSLLRAAILGVALASTPVMVAALPACSTFTAQSSQDRFLVAQESFIAITSTLIKARQNGDISAERWSNEINPLIQQANRARLAYESSLKNGEDPEIFRIILEQLVQELQLIDTSPETTLSLPPKTGEST